MQQKLLFSTQRALSHRGKPYESPTLTAIYTNHQCEWWWIWLRSVAKTGEAEAPCLVLVTVMKGSQELVFLDWGMAMLYIALHACEDSWDRQRAGCVKSLSPTLTRWGMHLKQWASILDSLLAAELVTVLGPMMCTLYKTLYKKERGTSDWHWIISVVLTMLYQQSLSSQYGRLIWNQNMQVNPVGRVMGNAIACNTLRRPPTCAHGQLGCFEGTDALVASFGSSGVTEHQLLWGVDLWWADYGSMIKKLIT